MEIAAILVALLALVLSGLTFWHTMQTDRHGVDAAYAEKRGATLAECAAVQTKARALLSRIRQAMSDHALSTDVRSFLEHDEAPDLQQTKQLVDEMAATLLAGDVKLNGSQQRRFAEVMASLEMMLVSLGAIGRHLDESAEALAKLLREQRQ